MATINFKSVGITAEKAQQTTTQAVSLPIGIKTPLQLGYEDGLLVMHYDLADQLADNLRNLLQTNWGERLGQYFFGANLKPLTTEFTSQESFDSEAVVRIKNAVTTWMPFIDLVDFISEVDRNENKNTAIIRVNIGYNIPALNITDRKIQVVLYVI
jgi:phage baseplate assembly protein W